jgi:hypothetical protein
MWILRRDGHVATAAVRVNSTLLEVQIAVDGTPLSVHTFGSGAEASAWAKTEANRMIAEEGWQDTRTPSDSFRRGEIVLYQPDEVLVALGVETTAMSDYIKELTEVTVRMCAAVATPQTLQVVVAVRPGGRSRVWLVSELPSAELSALREALEGVAPPPLKRGPLVFAMNGALADGVPRKLQTSEAFHFPLPDEWKLLMAGANTVEDVVNRAWPERQPSLLAKWWRA